MENTTSTGNPFTLPSLVATWSLPSRGSEDHQFYDVKFCPYLDDDDHPVFAIVGCRDILIYGTRIDELGLTDKRHILRDEEALGSEGLPILNTCSWAYIDQANPLLAVSGSSGRIKLLEACSGRLFTTLVGHGAGLINDLATHPKYPWILASASIDESIRIWDLRRWDDKYESPCIVICGQGHGHRQGLLSIAWHLSGRYIISGAHDNAVCLWAVPDLSDASEFWVSISPASRKSKSEAVHVLQYPHFVTSAVHSDYVDCVCFLGDMIVSKAASDPGEKNEIVLWEITGFDSKLPPPSSDSAPKTEEHKETRNGFYWKRDGLNNVQLNDDEPPEAEDKPAWVQHLEFDLPNAPYFYQRFGLLMPSRAHRNLHPVLVCGNAQAQILMWDLKRLELGHTDGHQTIPAGGRLKYETYIELAKKRQRKHAPILDEQRVSTPIRHPLGSHASSTPDTMGESPAPYPQALPDRERYSISDPFKRIKPHKTIKLPEDKDARTTFRGVSWSPCGRFCVVVGEGLVSENEEDTRKNKEGKSNNKNDGSTSKKTARGALLSRWV